MYDFKKRVQRASVWFFFKWILLSTETELAATLTRKQVSTFKIKRRLIKAIWRSRRGLATFFGFRPFSDIAVCFLPLLLWVLYFYEAHFSFTFFGGLWTFSPGKRRKRTCPDGPITMWHLLLGATVGGSLTADEIAALPEEWAYCFLSLFYF